MRRFDDAHRHPDRQTQPGQFPGLQEIHMNQRPSTTAAWQRAIAIAVFASASLTTVSCASTATREGTGEYIDDSVVTTRVKAAILADASLKSTEINVETFKGRVQLSGFVNSRPDIDHAVTVARAVKGVTSVTNDMRLK
jgi:osmotically-inducible protein OsmY